MRSRIAAILGALSVLLGVLITVVSAYGMTLAAAWARERVGLPTSYSGHRVVAPLGPSPEGVVGRVAAAMDESRGTLVVAGGAATGPAAVGVMDASGTPPLLGDAAGTAIDMAEVGRDWVVVVAGSYTARQVADGDSSTFLPPAVTVAGTTDYRLLPADTQFIYSIGPGGLSGGDYFIRAPEPATAAVLGALSDVTRSCRSTRYPWPPRF